MKNNFVWNDYIRTVCISGKVKRRLQFNKKKKLKETTIWSEEWIRYSKHVEFYKFDDPGEVKCIIKEREVRE